MSSSPLPAHLTKHISSLRYPFFDRSFTLTQLSDGHSNGTALWLGAQCLSLYLATVHTRIRRVPSGARPKALELGSGIGLTAYVLLSLPCPPILISGTIPGCAIPLRLALRSVGWDVLATDIHHVISSVLFPNIDSNTTSPLPTDGVIEIRELDWTVPPEQWDWDAPAVSPPADSPTPSPGSAQHLEHHLRPPFDLIISSDTLYTAELVDPLLRTLHAVSEQTLLLADRSPPIYLCIERRDSAVIDRALEEARTLWNFTVERVPHRKILKAMENGGLKWAKDDWDGVEIWKLVLRPALVRGNLRGHRMTPP